MSLRSEILNELESVAIDAAKGLFGYAEREKLRRRANPDHWHAFHSSMARRLPKIRWAARAYHKGMKRRYAAMLDSEPANPIASALRNYGAA